MATSPPTQAVTLTLSLDVIDFMHAKVASGEYATESDFIEAIMMQSILDPIPADELDTWLSTEVAARYDRLRANPESALTSEEVFESLGIDEIDSDEA